MQGPNPADAADGNDAQRIAELQEKAAAGDPNAQRELLALLQAKAPPPAANAPKPGGAGPAGPRNRPAGGVFPVFPVITPAVQANAMQNMFKDVQDAIEEENDSRVSQIREMRRMEHEKEIEMIRAQAALERVRQAKKADELSGNLLGPGLIDLTGTARRIG